MALPKKNNGKSRARRLAAGVFPSLLPGLFRCRLLIVFLRRWETITSVRRFPAAATFLPPAANGNLLFCT